MMSVQKSGLTLLIFVLAGMSKPAEVPVSQAKQNIFAFWYEDWQPGTTLQKLQAANVIVGVPEAAVDEIHKSGRRALQYVTFYQAKPGTAFLRNLEDLRNVGFRDERGFEKSAFGNDRYVLCPNSVEFRTRILEFTGRSLNAGFDGYFVDNTFLDPPAHQTCAAAHKHAQRGESGGAAYVDVIAMLRAKMKARNPAALLVINPGTPAYLDKIAPNSSSLWNMSDYVLWESYGYSSHRGAAHDRWNSTLQESFKLSKESNRASKIIALSYPTDRLEARFSFAVARIFGFAWTANLGQRDEGSTREGGHFGSFIDDVPFMIGDPVEPAPENHGSFLHRKFTNGEIFINIGPNNVTAKPPKGAFLYILDATPRKGDGSAIEVPPMSSLIVVQHASSVN